MKQNRWITTVAGCLLLLCGGCEIFDDDDGGLSGDEAGTPQGVGTCPNGLPDTPPFNDPNALTVRAVMTPTGGSPVTVTAEACYVCQTCSATATCGLQVFDIGGSSRFFQFSSVAIAPVAQGGMMPPTSTCPGLFQDFDAMIEDTTTGKVYVLGGGATGAQVQRSFGMGASPFATGSYSVVGSSEEGTFAFYEDDFIGVSIPVGLCSDTVVTGLAPVTLDCP